MITTKLQLPRLAALAQTQIMNQPMTMEHTVTIGHRQINRSTIRSNITLRIADNPNPIVHKMHLAENTLPEDTPHIADVMV